MHSKWNTADKRRKNTTTWQISNHSIKQQWKAASSWCLRGDMYNLSTQTRGDVCICHTKHILVSQSHDSFFSAVADFTNLEHLLNFVSLPFLQFCSKRKDNNSSRIMLCACLLCGCVWFELHSDPLLCQVRCTWRGTATENKRGTDHEHVLVWVCVT